jgi:hypothetical protein
MKTPNLPPFFLEPRITERTENLSLNLYYSQRTKIYAPRLSKTNKNKSKQGKQVFISNTSVFISFLGFSLFLKGAERRKNNIG